MGSLLDAPAPVQSEPAEWTPPVGPDPADRAEAAAWTLGYDAPVAAPGEPRLTMADWLAEQAAWYRSLGTELGDWLAGEIEGLRHEAKVLDARNPEQFDDRRAAFEAALDFVAECPTCGAEY